MPGMDLKVQTGAELLVYGGGGQLSMQKKKQSSVADS